MNTAEEKEIKLEVGLPSGGFPKAMYFNRFHIEREDEFCLVQFGLVSGSVLLDSYSCVLSKEAIGQNRTSLLDYLNRIGRPTEAAALPWKGTPVEKRAEVADFVTMAYRGQTAETCLYFFSLTAATRVGKSAAATGGVQGQPLVLLRCSADLQKQLIIGLYEE